jgi:hypothetical protein
MPTTFRARAQNRSDIVHAETLDGLIEAMKTCRPGRYVIEKLSVDPATKEVQAWEWGAIIKNRKGGIKLELPPWFD